LGSNTYILIVNPTNIDIDESWPFSNRVSRFESLEAAIDFIHLDTSEDEEKVSLDGVDEE
jgi:hypothetical protein